MYMILQNIWMWDFVQFTNEDEIEENILLIKYDQNDILLDRNEIIKLNIDLVYEMLKKIKNEKFFN